MNPITMKDSTLKEIMEKMTDDEINALIDKNDRKISKCDKNGNILHYACYKNRQKIVEFYASKNPLKLGSQNGDRETALHILHKEADNPEIAALFYRLFPGALGVRDKDGYVPLERMIMTNDAHKSAYRILSSISERCNKVKNINLLSEIYPKVIAKLIYEYHSMTHKQLKRYLGVYRDGSCEIENHTSNNKYTELERPIKECLTALKSLKQSAKTKPKTLKYKRKRLTSHSQKNKKLKKKTRIGHNSSPCAINIVK